MKYEPKFPTVVDFAYQIVDMDRELQQLREKAADLEHYKQQYHQLLSESISHSQHMIGELLELAMTPGVMAACAANSKKDPQP